MAIFDEIGKKISNAGQNVAKKGKEMSESFKINSLIAEEEKKTAGLYEEIGKAYISLYEGKYDEGMKEQIEALNESLLEIDKLRAQLAEVKSTLICSACGAENPKDALFCTACGKSLEKEHRVEPPKGGKICAVCGAQLDENAKFCTSCGNPV